MKLNPYLIVKEFSSSASENERKNAATALAVLGDGDSLRELLNLALNDSAEAVKEKAEAEISSLPPEHLGKILDWIDEKIRAGSADQTRAFLLLGRLRARGIRTRRPRVSFLRRLRLAKSRGEGPRSGRRRAILQSLWSSALGSVAGSIILASLVAGVFALGGSGDATVGYCFLALVVGIVLGMGSASLSTPLSLQADRAAGVFIDLGMSLVSSATFAMVVVALFEEGADTTSQERVCTILMFAAMALATRGAMLLVMGTSRGRLADAWWEICCGTGAGVVALTAVPGLLHVAENSAISSLWVIAVPAAAGISSAFATIDAQAPARRLFAGWARAAGFIPLIALVAAIVVLGIHARQPVAQPQIAEIVDGGAAIEQHSVGLPSLPVTVPFRTSQNELVQIAVGGYQGVLTYSLHSKTGQVQTGSSYYPSRPLSLPMGEYTIQVTGGGIVNAYPAKTLSSIYDRLTPKPSAAPVAVANLQLTFNVPAPAPAPSRAAPTIPKR